MQRMRILLILSCLLVSSGARADSDVRDYEAIAYAPNNTVVAFGYFRHVSDHALSVSLAVFRAVYIMRFGQFAFIPLDVDLSVQDITAYAPANAVLPMAPSFESYALHSSGVGDIDYAPNIAYVIPEGADGTSHTVLSFNPRITLPTGTYDDTRLINTGSNRYTFKPQLAIGQRFLSAFTAEVVANMAFHSSNDSFVVPGMGGVLMNTKMSQKPDISVDAHVGFDLSRSFYLGASYYVLAAGEQSLPAYGNVIATKAQLVQSLRFSFGIRITPTTVALLQYNQDVSATNGATIQRWFGVRLSHVFVEQPEPSVPEPRKLPPERVPNVVDPSHDESQ